MDTRIEIKEEDPLSIDTALQNEKELFFKHVIVKTNSDCDTVIEREMKSENAIPYLCSQNERICFTKHSVQQIKSETITCCNNWEIDNKTETEKQILDSSFGSHNEREILPEDPIMKAKNDDDNVEIKGEPLWLETETSPVCNEIENEGFLPVESSRLSTKAVSGDSNAKSLWPSPEVSRKDTAFYNGKYHPQYEREESNITEISTTSEHSPLEQSSKCNDGNEIYNRPFIHESIKSHKCERCGKDFLLLSNLKRHKLIHGGKKPHKCKTCDKSFTRLLDLKRHIVIHEGKQPYKCEICEKGFTHLSSLKRHNLIHEGRKPHKCATCDKRFTQLSHLKQHTLIHEGIRPYKCESCDKNFTDLSNLKKHYLIHEDKRKHKCEICDKSFTALSNLKMHNLIHDGRKPHICKTCKRSFTRFSHLKMHNLIHEGRKPHKCEICEKEFTHLSSLKRHCQWHKAIQA